MVLEGAMRSYLAVEMSETAMFPASRFTSRIQPIIQSNIQKPAFEDTVGTVDLFAA
jgi:hypothetical protein